jgi:hypothetical protein
MPQFARKFLVRHQLRCRGIELCFRAWYALAEVEPHEGCWSFGRLVVAFVRRMAGTVCCDIKRY